MTLTKADIQKIDSYLKENGISYWDIRLEMIDHIACEIENKKGSYDFESAFNHTLEKLGWTGNLKTLENQRLKSINVKIRSAYFKNFLALFGSLKNVAAISVGVFLYYFVLENASLSSFNIITLLLFVGPIAFITLHYVIASFKIKKSGYLFYAYFYVIFAMLMTNMFYQIPKPDGIIEVSQTTRNTIVFFATIANVLFTIGGIKIYLKTFMEYNAITEKLNKNRS
jgi:hypothetical protein